jgi:hypothetical protein
MIHRFQNFKFDQSKYDRPSQKWVCGWAAAGKACHVGPDGKGRCIAQDECTPLKNGDRWSCARAKEFGGRCATGPMPDGRCCNPIPPCQPVKSFRARRGAISRWSAFLVLGFLLLSIAGPAGPEFISPGSLTPQHQTAASSCGNCHSTFEGGPAGWLAAAFTSHSGAKDSRLCIACHILGKNSNSPHGLSPQSLAVINKRIVQKRIAEPDSLNMLLADSLGLRGEHGPGSTVACATCHQEHQGRSADITDMNARRCQSCHAARFTSLGAGHPEFLSFPYNRRTRVIFNHTSHLNKHFIGEVKDRVPTSCKSCHLPDPAGTYMKTGQFEKTCAACHEGQILGDSSAGAKGIPFITLPGLDAEGLKKARIDVGHWPKDAEGEGLTPFLRLLLSVDPEFKKAERVLSDADLLDLEKEEIDVRVAAGRLAWAIKVLVYEVAAGGQKALKARLEKALARPLGAAELSRLSAQFPIGVMRGVMAAWFPDLAAEIERRKDGEPPGKEKGDEEKNPEEKEEKELPSPEEVSVAGGWYEQDFTLYYRPSGHEDRFMRGWLDLAVGGAASGGAREKIFKTLSGNNSPGYCVKCHSIDQVGEKALRINWRAKGPASNVRGFTRYRHAPHFSLLDEKGCLTCHRLDPGAKYLDGFKDFNPGSYVSNFQPIQKAVCASCHTRNGASDKCLTCHNYHIGEVRPALSSVPMRIPEAPVSVRK